MAFVTYHPLWQGKRSEVIPHDKAKAILHALHHPEVLADLTDEQVNYLQHIQVDKHGKPAVYLGKQAAAKQEPDTSHLTNVGVAQGKLEILPRGDR